MAPLKIPPILQSLPLSTAATVWCLPSWARLAPAPLEHTFAIPFAKCFPGPTPTVLLILLTLHIPWTNLTVASRGFSSPL